MIVVEINGKKQTVPENWNEIQKDHLLVISKYLGRQLFYSQPNENQVMANRILAIRKFLKVSWFKFIRFNEDEINDLLKLLDFVKDEPVLNRQLIQSTKVAGTVYYGAKAFLRNSSFDEFIYADTKFVEFCNAPSEDKLQKLFFSLYRPKRKDIREFMESPEWNGDLREEFNSKKTDERVEKYGKKVKPELLIATLFFYWGFRNTNLLKYELLFPKKEESDKNDPPKNKYGWAATRLAISGDKFGDYRDTGKTQWQTVIFDMHRLEEIRQKEEMKRKFNSKSKK